MNTLARPTPEYFEVVGTLTLPTSGDCPSSWRAFQTIEAGTTSCFALPVVITAAASNVITVTYTYPECPEKTKAIAQTITVVLMVQNAAYCRMNGIGFRLIQKAGPSSPLPPQCMHEII